MRPTGGGDGRTTSRHLIQVVSFSLFFLQLMSVSEAQRDLDKEADFALEVEALEWDLEVDVCKPLQTARWNYLLRNGQGYVDDMVDAAVNAANLRRKVADSSRSHLEQNFSGDKEMKRRVELLVKPGPVVLAEEDYRKATEFRIQAEQKQREPLGFLSYGSEQLDNTSLAAVPGLMATIRDEAKLGDLWSAWEKAQGPSNLESWPQFLELLNREVEINDEESINEYWEQRSEWKRGYYLAEQLWREIDPLYRKFHGYVRRRLQAHYKDVPHHIPIYMLGSPLGYDWSYVADLVLPQSGVYRDLQNNLAAQGLGGSAAYKKASELVRQLFPTSNELKGDDLFAPNSLYNASCPGEIFPDCSSNSVRVLTCSEVSWQRYLEAYELTFRAAQVKLVASLGHSYVFRQPDRFSGITSAMSNLGSLLATARVLQDGLLERDGSDPGGQAINLRLLVALRVLPRLPALLSADQCRLREASFPSDTPASCWIRRKDMQMVSPPKGQTPNWDNLGDSYMTSNTPYLSEFAGLVLQFQFLEHLLNNVKRPGHIFTGDVTSRLTADDKFSDLLSQGHINDWSILLEDFGIEDVNSQPLLNFFKPLIPLFDDMSTVEEIPKEEEEENTSEHQVTLEPVESSVDPPLAEGPAPTALPLPEPTVDVFDNSTEENIQQLPSEESSGGIYSSTTFIAIAAVALGVVIVVASVFLINRSRKSRVETRRKQRYDPVMRHSVGRPASFSPVAGKRLSENDVDTPPPQFTTFKDMDGLQTIKLSDPAELNIVKE